MTHVMACIDNSQSSLAVCDYAAWASQQLNAPLSELQRQSASDAKPPPQYSPWCS